MEVESIDDQVSRLRAMIGIGQQTWDLSPNDKAAISMAVRVLSVIQSIKPRDGISTFETMSGCELLCNGVRYANSSLLACLSDAGQTTKIITRSRWNNEQDENANARRVVAAKPRREDLSHLWFRPGRLGRSLQ